MSQTFGKEERLKSKKTIDDLFQSGRWLNEDPVRLVYKIVEFDGTVPAKVGVSVPKSTMKRAVDRNKFKRRMREAYRRNKTELLEFLSVHKWQCALMFIYKGDVQTESVVIEEKICALMQRLMNEHG